MSGIQGAGRQTNRVIITLYPNVIVKFITQEETLQFSLPTQNIKATPWWIFPILVIRPGSGHIQ